MTKVKLTKAAGGHDAGATIDVTPGVAARFLEIGAATEVDGDSKPAAKADPKPKQRGSNTRSGVGATPPTRPTA